MTDTAEVSELPRWSIIDVQSRSAMDTEDYDRLADAHHVGVP